MLVGITGGIASGKTYLCNYLKSKNYIIFESDHEIAKLAQREEIIKEIKIAFPELEGEKINKEILREICLTDHKRLIILQNIYYHFLNIELNNFLSIHSNKKELVFIEAPLLFEVGYDKFVKRVITVVADLKTKEQRFINRGLKKQDFKRFLSIQMSDEERLEKTDYIIYSNNEINNVELQIENIINSLNNERNSS